MNQIIDFKRNREINSSVLVEDADTTMLTALGAALLMMDVLLLTRDEHRLVG